MKKLLVCGFIYLAVALSYKVVSAEPQSVMVDEPGVAAYTDDMYKHIDFTGCNRLSYDVFQKAYTGYINLRNAGKLNMGKEIISICDFTLPSTENRLWIIDLASGKVLFNSYVAHGQGSGENYAETFSNKTDSHQSSLGFYVTTDIYNGDHGVSLHLEGMDRGFNDAAMDRGIVVHGADYVCDQFICENNRLGRSWGCPAVPDKLKTQIINTIEGGTCLFIYAADKKYNEKSYWLNKKVDRFPEVDFLQAQAVKTPKIKPSHYVIQYMHGDKIDSVKTIPIAE